MDTVGQVTGKMVYYITVLYITEKNTFKIDPTFENIHLTLFGLSV